MLLCIQCESSRDDHSRAQWIKNNANSIELFNSNNFEDLRFLQDILKDKRVVFIGESAHGVSEYNTIKSRMIRYMHKELGFEVLAFECNSGDAFAVNLESPYDQAETALYNSVSTFWHVEENVPLFEYINHSSSSDNKLHIAGIDITQSNGSYAFSRFLKSLIEPVDTEYAEYVRTGDSLFSALGVRKWTLGLDDEQMKTYDSIKDMQLRDYQDIINFINKHRSELKAPDKHVAASIFYLKSRINFIHQVNRDSAYMAEFLGVHPSRGKSTQWLFKQFRERHQSENLKFLAHKLYPDKKIIVWAQNTHIEKRNRNRMPFRLAQTDSVYSIGFFNYEGKGCYSFGQGFDGTPPEDMIYNYKVPSDSLRIEKILTSSGYDITFVDMKYQKKTEGNSWMFEKSKYAAWDGTNVNEVDNIKDKWDAIIVVKQISPPNYLDFSYDYLNNY